jgi:hypothetical protein
MTLKININLSSLTHCSNYGKKHILKLNIIRESKYYLEISVFYERNFQMISELNFSSNGGSEKHPATLDQISSR